MLIRFKSSNSIIEISRRIFDDIMVIIFYENGLVHRSSGLPSKIWSDEYEEYVTKLDNEVFDEF